MAEAFLPGKYTRTYEPLEGRVQHLSRGEVRRKTIGKKLATAGAAITLAASLIAGRSVLFPQQSQQPETCSTPTTNSAPETKVPVGGWRKVKMTDLGVWVSSQLGMYSNTDSYDIPDFYPKSGPDSLKLQEIIELVNPTVNFGDLKKGTLVEVPDRETMVAFIDEFHNITTDASSSVYIPKGQAYGTCISDIIRLQGSLQQNDPRIPIAKEIEEIVFGYKDNTQSTGDKYKILSGKTVREILVLLNTLNQPGRRAIQ